MKVIIIRGLTGAGKTELLNKIVETYHFKKVEADDYKRKKYGTTERFDAVNDLPEVGKIAKSLVDQGNNVVIEETFTDLKHIDFFKKGFEEFDSHEVTYIYLKCSLETALKRKKDSVKASTIKSAYKEVTDPILGQLEYDTDTISTDSILTDLKRKFFR